MTHTMDIMLMDPVTDHCDPSLYWVDMMIAWDNLGTAMYRTGQNSEFYDELAGIARDMAVHMTNVELSEHRMMGEKE